MGRPGSQNRAFGQSGGNSACLSGKSPKEKTTCFWLDRTIRMMTAYFAPDPDIPFKESPLCRLISELNAERTSHSSAQSSKYRKVWKNSMEEDFDGLNSSVSFLRIGSQIVEVGFTVEK